MRKEELILLSVVVLIALIGPVLVGSSGLTGKATAVAPSCVDSDGGQNLNVKGEITYSMLGRFNKILSGSMKDSCGLSNTVNEGFCIGNNPVFANIPCVSGSSCVDGACRIQKVPSNQVEIGISSDPMELGKSIGSIRPAFTDYDLNGLKGGVIQTSKGAVKYNQYLKFPDLSASNSSKVLFKEDAFDNVGHFLFWKDGDEIFTWNLYFENGFTTPLSQENYPALIDLQGKLINILGKYHLVHSAYIAGAGSNAIKLNLLSGSIFDALTLGAKKTYWFNGKQYAVEVVSISQGFTQLKVNGVLLPNMQPLGIEATPDGLLIAIASIDNSGKFIRLFLDATQLVLKDDNFEDNNYMKTSGVYINNEQIKNVEVKINAQISTDKKSIQLSSINYKLKSEGYIENIDVPPGHTLNEYMNNSDGMINSNFVINYNGLSSWNETTIIKLNPIGKDEYKLEFTNQEGLHVIMPFLSTRKDGLIRQGEFISGVQNNLHISEYGGSDQNKFPVKINDYFILSDISNTNRGQSQVQDGLNSSGPGGGNVTFIPKQHKDNTAFTRVLRFIGIDTNNKVLTFSDLATGTKQTTYREENGVNVSVLIVGGSPYQVKVASKGQTNSLLSIDLNGDGLFNDNTTAVIATQGGGLIIPSHKPSLEGQSNVNFSLTILAKQFAGSSNDEYLIFVVEARAGNQIGIRARNPVETSDGSKFIYLPSEPEFAQLLTKYGVFAELFDPLGLSPVSNKPEEITIEYPLKQRLANVTVVLPQKSEFNPNMSPLLMSCTDSDGGVNFNKKGNVTGTNINGEKYTYVDFCSRGYVFDYSCSVDKTAQQKSKQCANCVDGACI